MEQFVYSIRKDAQELVAASLVLVVIMIIPAFLAFGGVLGEVTARNFVAGELCFGGSHIDSSSEADISCY